MIQRWLIKPLTVFLILFVVGIGVDLSFDGFIKLTLIYVLINMILALSLNLVNGITGQFSLGHAGFMAVGAYVSAYLSTLLVPTSGPEQLAYFMFFALCGGAAAALAGYIVGLPSLRLKGDYLAIVTLGFGEIIRVVLLNTKAVGGARGMYGIQGPMDWQVGATTVSKFIFGYTNTIFWLLTCFYVIWRLLRSAHGRAFLSVREDEMAAEAMGINTTRSKVLAFVISSFFAGVAGSIFAHYSNYLNPSTFSFNKSVDAVIMVVLGGMGSLSGSMLAAAFITILPEALRPLQQYTGVDLRMIIYSLALILLMILRPQGIMGGRELSQLLPSRWRKNASKSA